MDAGSQKPRFVETDGRGLYPGVDGDRLRKKKKKKKILLQVRL